MDMVGVERAHELWTDGGSATCSTMGQKEGDWFSSDKQHSQMKDEVYRVTNFNAMPRKNGEPIAANFSYHYLSTAEVSLQQSPGWWSCPKL